MPHTADAKRLADAVWDEIFDLSQAPVEQMEIAWRQIQVQQGVEQERCRAAENPVGEPAHQNHRLVLRAHGDDPNRGGIAHL
jgi:hypothetical protein